MPSPHSSSITKSSGQCRPDGATQQLRVTELNQQVSAARLRTEEAKTRYQQAQRDLKANVEGPVKQDLLSVLRKLSAQRSTIKSRRSARCSAIGILISSSHTASSATSANKKLKTNEKAQCRHRGRNAEAMLDQQKSPGEPVEVRSEAEKC